MHSRVTDLGIANLLAHKAIHSLQFVAAGGFDSFFEYYKSGGTSYLDKPYERAACKFGPYYQDAIDAGSLPTPILERNGNWFL
jgi:hypothetical protein